MVSKTSLREKSLLEDCADLVCFAGVMMTLTYVGVSHQAPTRQERVASSVESSVCLDPGYFSGARANREDVLKEYFTR